MIIGLIIYSTLLCAFIAMIKLIKPTPSYSCIQVIRFQVECIFDLFGKWVPYLIAVVPVLIILAMPSQSNHIVVSMEILFLFSLIMLVLFHRMKQTRILSASVLHK